MIPKILHYCWFGRGQMGPVALKCMESWKKYCPDYQIKVWNEDNFDIGQNTFVKEAYEEKKWAFVTDYVRLYALYTEGGIYLDSDIELLKNLDDLLSLGGGRYELLGLYHSCCNHACRKGKCVAPGSFILL